MYKVPGSESEEVGLALKAPIAIVICLTKNLFHLQDKDIVNVTGKLLEKVIEYLYYRHRFTDANIDIPEFEIDTVSY